jgi:hypothetical protein
MLRKRYYMSNIAILEYESELAGLAPDVLLTGPGGVDAVLSPNSPSKLRRTFGHSRTLTIPLPPVLEAVAGLDNARRRGPCTGRCSGRRAVKVVPYALSDQAVWRTEWSSARSSSSLRWVWSSTSAKQSVQ